MFFDRYTPTDLATVEAMLQLADLKPGELHIDLGSGDGRVCAVAAEKFHARSIGYELDPELVRKSQEYIGPSVKIINADCLDADVSEADVVSFWFIKGLMQIFVKLKKEMKPGSRIVYNGLFKDYPADKVKKLWNGSIGLYYV